MEPELAKSISETLSIAIILAFLASLWLWCRLLVRHWASISARFSALSSWCRSLVRHWPLISTLFPETSRPAPSPNNQAESDTAPASDRPYVQSPPDNSPYSPPTAVDQVQPSDTDPAQRASTSGFPDAMPLVPMRSRRIPFWNPSFAIVMLGLMIVLAGLLGHVMPANQQQALENNTPSKTETADTPAEPVAPTNSDTPTTSTDTLESDRPELPSESTESQASDESDVPLQANGPPKPTAAEPPSTMSLNALIKGGAASVLASILITLILGCLLAAKPNGGTLFSELGFVLSVRDVNLGLIATLAILPPTMLVMGLVSMLQEYSHPVLERLNQQPDLTVFATLFVVTALITPVFEEFWFRVILQGGFQRLADEHRPSADSDQWTPTAWWPLWITSIIFALMHMGQGLAPIPLFFLSLGLGYLYRQTGSIWPTVIVHMVLNSLTMLVTFVTMFTQNS